MVNKLLWSGKPSSIHVVSGGYDNGSVKRHSGRETIDNGDGTFTQNELFDTLLSEFQNDIILFSEDEFYIGEVEASHEFYDYDAHFHKVIRVEQRKHGDLEITINYRSSASSAKVRDENKS